MRMPLSDIVESRVVVICRAKEFLERANYGLDGPNERCETTAPTLNRQFPNSENALSQMLAHEDSADFALFSFL